MFFLTQAQVGDLHSARCQRHSRGRGRLQTSSLRKVDRPQTSHSRRGQCLSCKSDKPPSLHLMQQQGSSRSLSKNNFNERDGVPSCSLLPHSIADVLRWSPAQVKEWILKIGLPEHIAARFEEKGVNGHVNKTETAGIALQPCPQTLLHISPQDLDSGLHITHFNVRKQILTNIAHLRGSMGPSPHRHIYSSLTKLSNRVEHPVRGGNAKGHPPHGTGTRATDPNVGAECPPQEEHNNNHPLTGPQ